MLLCLCSGVAPWNVADKSDETYMYMTSGFMKGLLKSWNLSQYVDDDLTDLLQAVFQDENNRISLQKIKDHPFIKYPDS